MKAINLIINILKARSQNKLIEKINQLCEAKIEDAEQLYNYIFNDEREAVRIAALKKINNISTLLKIEKKQIFTPENSFKEFNILQRKIRLQKVNYCLEKNCNITTGLKYLSEFNNKELLEIATNTSNKELALKAFSLIKDNELRFKLFRKSSDKKILQKVIFSLANNAADKLLLEKLKKSAPNSRLQKIANKRLEFLEKKTEDKQVKEQIQEKNPLKTEQKKKIEAYEKVITELKTLRQTIKENTSFENINKTTQLIKDIQQQWNNLPEIPVEYYEVLAISFTKEKTGCKKELRDIEDYLKKQDSLQVALQELSEKIDKELINFSVNDSGDFKKYESKIKKLSYGLNSIKEKYHSLLNTKDISTVYNELQTKIINAKNQLKLINECVTEQLENMIKEADEMLTVLDDNHQIKEKSNELLDILNNKIIITNHSEHNSLINKLRRNLKAIKNHLINEYHSNDLTRWQNYTEKLNLCEAVESLHQNNDLHYVAKKLKKYRESWNKIGSVPKEKNEEIWQRFQKNTNELFDKCSNFYESLREQQSAAIEKKYTLIKKAQNLVLSEDYSQTAKEFSKLFEKWKAIGYVGDKIEEEKLFKKFKELNDQFYERKQQFFSERNKKFQDNAEKKQELIMQAKDLLSNLNNTEKNISIKSAKQLRKNWKEIGTTKRSEEEKLWHEFNSTLNNIFNKLNGDKEENLAKKNIIIDKLNTFKNEFFQNIVDENSKIDFTEFKKLRNEFFSIGQCEKDSEHILQQQFTEICDAIFDEQKTIYKNYFTKRENIIEELENLYLEIQKNSSNIAIIKPIIKSAKELQQSWQNFMLPKKTKEGQEQWERFQAIGNNIFALNNKLFANENGNREKNYQEKLSLCLQLESIVSKFTAANDNDEDISLSGKDANSLALELKMAITNNTANEINSLKSASKEINNINNKWQQIGAVPSKNAEEIYSRYRNARQKFLAVLNNQES